MGLEQVVPTPRPAGTGEAARIRFDWGLFPPPNTEVLCKPVKSNLEFCGGTNQQKQTL